MQYGVECFWFPSNSWYDDKKCKLSLRYGKPFVPPVKGNVKGNGEVNCNGKQLTNGKRNDSVNGKKSNNAQS